MGGTMKSGYVVMRCEHEDILVQYNEGEEFEPFGGSDGRRFIKLAAGVEVKSLADGAEFDEGAQYVWDHAPANRAQRFDEKTAEKLLAMVEKTANRGGEVVVPMDKYQPCVAEKHVTVYSFEVRHVDEYGFVNRADNYDNADKVKRLKSIEKSLVSELSGKRRGWADIYLNMDSVERNALWAAAGYSSMTKWVEGVARKSGCQVQYLWRVKRAGKFYQAYREEQMALGCEVKPIEQCGFGDELLDDINRLTDGDMHEAGRIMSALASGAIFKSEIKEQVKYAAAQRRAKKHLEKQERERAEFEKKTAEAEAAGVDIFEMLHDERERKEQQKQKEVERKKREDPTARDILKALKNPRILASFDDASTTSLLHEFVGEVAHTDYRYAVLPEFPVKTGTTRHARRMDALVISNAMTGNNYECVLDMVEIKVAKSDLVRDEKHMEYEPFADRCWFAVPRPLEAEAKECAPDGWGVIIYDKETRALTVAQYARTRKGVMRAVTLATALLRLAPMYDAACAEFDEAEEANEGE